MFSKDLFSVELSLEIRGLRETALTLRVADLN